MSGINTRLGLLLFAVYLAFYLCYVVTNAFAPQVMESTPIDGVNLAILSGSGLIVLAWVLAIVYGLMAKPDDTEAQSSEVSQ